MMGTLSREAAWCMAVHPCHVTLGHYSKRA